MTATKVHQITESNSRAAASTSASSSTAPSAPISAPHDRSLNQDDQAFLSLREEVIDAGRNAFLAVGIALLEIREYRDGLLYAAQFGTFERYCKVRWDFGRAHAYRLTDAAQIYRDLCPENDRDLSPSGDADLSKMGGSASNDTVTRPLSPVDLSQNCDVAQHSTLNTQLLPPLTSADFSGLNHHPGADGFSQPVGNEPVKCLSPMGDKPSEDLVIGSLSPQPSFNSPPLPTNERQLRPLKKLADPELRRQAWERARQAAGSRPPLGRQVERAVRSLIIETGSIAPGTQKAKSPRGSFHKISAADVGEIRKCMKTIRETARVEGFEALLWSVFQRVDALLP